MINRIIAAGAAALAGVAFSASPVHAQQETFSAQLSPLNRSGDSGSASVSVSGNRVTVRVETNGVSANAPHAQHIHIGGSNTCPPASAAGQNEPRDLIDTAEGQPSYGEVRVSLTTEGGTGADSALAVERFPTADAGGRYVYTRTFDLPSGVTVGDVRRGVVVVHGISELFGDPAAYDGDPRSSLSPDLPLEATIPALCGKLAAAQVAAAPQGGVSAGAGGTADAEVPLPLVAGAVGLLAGVAVMLIVQRPLPGHREAA